MYYLGSFGTQSKSKVITVQERIKALKEKEKNKKNEEYKAELKDIKKNKAFYISSKYKYYIIQFLGNKIQDIKSIQKLNNIINEMSINIKDGNNKSMDEGKDRSEKHLRKRKDKEHKLRNKKIKKDKFKKVNNNNFEIISEKYGKMLKIDNVCKLNQFGGAKTFNNSFLITATVVDLDMIKIHHYSNLKQCFEIKELNYNSEKNDQKKNVNSYLVESFNKEIIADKKIKYNESEVIISSNVININLEKIRKIIDNERISKNGLSLDELKIRKKRKNQNISNVEKVKKIIDNIKKESIMKKILKGKKNSLNNNNYYFCLDCYEYNDNNEVENEHKGHFIIEIDDFKDLEDELDYNQKLNKIYEILKKGQNQILQNGNNNLILY